MKINPRPNRRNVYLDTETVSLNLDDRDGALSGLRGRLVCIAMLADDGQDVEGKVLIDRDEKAMIRGFWDFVRPSDLFIGFNCLAFDLSFIRQRTWIEGIRPSRKLDLRRFYSSDTFDLMQVFSGWGMTKFPSLDELSKALGCHSKIAHGTDVQQWWAASDFGKIAEYCLADVVITAEVFHKMIFRPLPARFFTLSSLQPWSVTPGQPTQLISSI